MSRYYVTDTELTSVANAIRTKGGTSAELEFPTGFVTAIGNISGGGTVNLQAKTNISPTTSSQTIQPDSGYDGLSSVQINAMPSGSASTPATTITANPSISVGSDGLITATTSKTQSVTPTVSAGYVSSGTAGTITVSGSATSQLTAQAAQTIHPSTSDQTIASGKYLTGAQTVKGVLLTNLSAGNIKKDVVVKVGDSTDDDCVTSVTGTYEGGGGGAQYKSGTYTPAEDYTTTGNRLITTLANIGFSPKKFIFRVTDRASVANTKNAALYSLADNDAAVRWSCRYSDTSNSVGQNRAFSDWTTQQEMFLYCDGTSVYFRTYNNQYFLLSGVSYTWEAFG